MERPLPPIRRGHAVYSASAVAKSELPSVSAWRDDRCDAVLTMINRDDIPVAVRDRLEDAANTEPVNGLVRLCDSSAVGPKVLIHIVNARRRLIRAIDVVVREGVSRSVAPSDDCVRVIRNGDSGVVVARPVRTPLCTEGVWRVGKKGKIAAGPRIGMETGDCSLSK